VGRASFLELPAGMLDDAGSFVGVAAKEMAEETRRQQALQEKKEAKKLKESMQQRLANITYAKEHGQYDWGIQRQPDLPKLKGGSPSKTGGGAE
jgi:8-oxo-dGTP pyrophosphatase MutT (NUDIX family)